MSFTMILLGILAIGHLTDVIFFKVDQEAYTIIILVDRNNILDQAG